MAARRQLHRRLMSAGNIIAQTISYCAEIARNRLARFDDEEIRPGGAEFREAYRLEKRAISEHFIEARS
jgi:hypothetical protein